MTIVEFLNARLDEAEEDIELAGRDPIDWYYTKPEWVRADVAAKRRMTERAWLSVQYTPPAERTVAEGAQAIHAFWVLAELASIYSDHPDYDEAWKP